MQTNLQQPVRGYAGDVDIQTSIDSNAMTKEIYDYMKEQGYNVKLRKQDFHGTPKYHITLDGMEFINAGTSYDYFSKTQINPLLGLFERKGFTMKSPDGNIQISPLRDQLRVKIQKGYVEGFRPKDVIDVAGIVKATNHPSYHKQSILSQIQNKLGLQTNMQTATNQEIQQEIKDIQQLRQQQIQQFNQQASQDYQNYYQANQQYGQQYNQQYPVQNNYGNNVNNQDPYQDTPYSPVYQTPT